MKKACVLSYPLSAQRILCSEWVDAQVDLSLRSAHTHFVGFLVSQLIFMVMWLTVSFDVVSPVTDISMILRSHVFFMQFISVHLYRVRLSLGIDSIQTVGSVLAFQSHSVSSRLPIDYACVVVFVIQIYFIPKKRQI